MKNYYEFKNLNYEKESINFYKSLSTKDLKTLLDKNFNYIEYYLFYYAEILKALFNDSDYNEHYYMMKALVEELNNIKIILNILKGRNNNG